MVVASKVGVHLEADKEYVRVKISCRDVTKVPYCG